MISTDPVIGTSRNPEFGMFRQFVMLAGMVVGTSLGMAQTQVEIPTAPVPVQITHANKIFLANAASEKVKACSAGESHDRLVGWL